MVSILSPTPKHASSAQIQPLERPLSLKSPPIYLSTDLPRSSGFFSPPRLMSPINLSSGTVHKSNLSKTPAQCSSTKRRRTNPTTSRTTRRRHCARPECPVTYVNGLHAFDQLPWISQIESEPSEPIDLWNIADLSLLPDLPSSGVGPVRTRKSSSSSRSGVPASIGGAPLAEAQGLANMATAPIRSRSPVLPLELLPAADSEAFDPRTPTGVAFNPFEVTFRNLMPAFPPDRVESRTPAKGCL